jgi:hypothetical protein
MGLFSKTISERKWIEVSGALHKRMKADRSDWFKDFTDHVVPLDIGLRRQELTPEIERHIGFLQFAAAATTIRENGYVGLKDFDFFIDLVCISITSNKMEKLDRLSLEILIEPDPSVATQRWALAVSPLVAQTTPNQALTDVLAQWAMGLVVGAKIRTCEACFDRQGAAAIRAVFVS